MLPKITITIEGPGRKGIGKSMVTAIIAETLHRFNYEVNFVALPGIDDPASVSEYEIRASTEVEKQVISYVTDSILKRCTLPTHVESTPQATINLIEKL